MQAIVAELGPETPEPGRAIPFTEEQFEALCSAESSASQGDVQHAIGVLKQLLKH